MRSESSIAACVRNWPNKNGDTYCVLSCVHNKLRMSLASHLEATCGLGYESKNETISRKCPIFQLFLLIPATLFSACSYRSHSEISSGGPRARSTSSVVLDPQALSGQSFSPGCPILKVFHVVQVAASSRKTLEINPDHPLVLLLLDQVLLDPHAHSTTVAAQVLLETALLESGYPAYNQRVLTSQV